MKHDIKDRKDIEILIRSFYDKVIVDPEIGFIFSDVAKVNWEAHLPIMYDFWETTLFHNMKYSGNPMLVHKKLNEKLPLTDAHFDRWLALFNETVDDNFEGEKAYQAKNRALSIATVIRIKLAAPSGLM